MEKSATYEVKNKAGENVSAFWDLVECNNLKGWVMFDNDFFYGMSDYLLPNAAKIKKTYLFQKEVGGAYEFQNLIVSADKKKFIVTVTIDGPKIIEEIYSDYQKTEDAKWKIINESSTLMLTKIGRDLKLEVLSDKDDKFKKYHNYTFTHENVPPPE
ncbi:MAG: hypothetical protein K8R21_01335 [Leptospira sp.]|nr:hypothetical protein [Leptospira sp.]